MIIGNDLVDLRSSPSIDRNERYLNLCFTRSELALLRKVKIDQPWLLWSIKEAAYKVHLKKSFSRFQSPHHIIIHSISKIENWIESSVEINNTAMISRSEINQHYVHSICMNKPVFDFLDFQVNVTVENASKESRQHLRSSLPNGNEMLSFYKDEHGIPKCNLNDRKISISFSHCGNFNSYAYSMI